MIVNHTYPSYDRTKADQIFLTCYVSWILFADLSRLQNKFNENILLTETTAAQNEVALSYHRVRGQYFQAVVFVRSIFGVRFNIFPSDSDTTLKLYILC